MSVVHDISRPESVLRKKSNSVCDHTLHESVAMSKSLVGQIPSKENVADLMTMSFMSKEEDTWLAIFFMTKHYVH